MTSTPTRPATGQRVRNTSTTSNVPAGTMGTVTHPGRPGYSVAVQWDAGPWVYPVPWAPAYLAPVGARPA